MGQSVEVGCLRVCVCRVEGGGLARKSIWGLKFNFLETYSPFFIDVFVHVSLWPAQAFPRLTGLYLPFDKEKQYLFIPELLSNFTQSFTVSDSAAMSNELGTPTIRLQLFLLHTLVKMLSAR